MENVTVAVAIAIIGISLIAVLAFLIRRENKATERRRAAAYKELNGITDDLARSLRRSANNKSPSYSRSKSELDRIDPE